MAFVVVGQSAGAALLQRQAGLGSVEGLDLALLVEREHDGVLRRVHVEPDDVTDLGRELRIVRELEGADAVRRQPVCAPDTLNRGQADPGGPGHSPAGPVGRLSGRFAEGQRDDALGHLRAERRDAGRPRLVAKQTFDTLLHEALLPPPHRRLALGRAAHDRDGAEAFGGGEHDPGAPHVLLWAVAVRHDSFEPVTVRGGQFDGNSCAHRQDSHVRRPAGILNRIPASGSIH